MMSPTFKWFMFETFSGYLVINLGMFGLSCIFFDDVIYAFVMGILLTVGIREVHNIMKIIKTFIRRK